MVLVLGPPALTSADGPRPVAGLPGRLLVALAATARPMDVDRLTEVLWGGTPPKTARPAMHVHLGALRRAFAEQADGPRIERAGGGYRLDLRGWRLDVDVARDDANRARDLLDVDADGALELIGSALPLWRGPPFTVGGDPVDPVAARIAEELRQELQELEVAALLALGDLTRAERLAMQLVEEEPYRELRWAQLLRCRYRSGRVREALSTYQDARRVMAEGLGVAPGPMLRDLERAVLTHDEALLAGGSRTPLPSLPPPPRPVALYGRDRELHRCMVSLTAGRLVVIHGPPGVGKTTLGAELAHRHPQRGALWLDLRQDLTSEDVLRQLTGAPGSGASHPGSSVSCDVRLVVLDDADAVAGAVGDIVGGLRRAAPAAALAVLSRSRLDLDAVFVSLDALPLPPIGATSAELDASPAVQALRAALQDLAPHVTLNPETTVAVCHQTGGLPLALRLAAATARAIPAHDLPAGVTASIRAGLRPAVETAARLAGPQAASLFRHLGLLREAFDTCLAATISRLSREETSRALVALADHGLVHVSPGSARPYFLVEPLRDVAEQLLVDAGGCDGAWDRLADWCLELARTLNRATSDGRTPASARAATELPVFQRVMDRLVLTGDAQRGLRLARLLDAPLYLAGRWWERNRLMEQALSIAGPPTADRALVHALRGRAGPLSTLDPTRFDEAERIAADVGAHAVAAYARHLRGIYMWWNGDVHGALAEHRRAAEWFEAHGDRRALEARKYEALALIHAGQVDPGLASLRDVANRYQELGRTALLGHTLALVGHCHRFLGDDDAALVDWRHALTHLLPLGNEATAIHVQLGLGELALDQGDPREAMTYVGAALDRITSSGNVAYAPWAWTVAMRAAALDGDLDRALGCARSALQIAPFTIAGESARLANELAIVSASSGAWRHAARLLGCGEGHDGRRELPFPPPSEAHRWATARASVRSMLGPEFDRHVELGRRCTVAEAAGELIAGGATSRSDQPVASLDPDVRGTLHLPVEGLDRPGPVHG